jgi:hypothetical protein
MHKLIGAYTRRLHLESIAYAEDTELAAILAKIEDAQREIADLALAEHDMAAQDAASAVGRFKRNCAFRVAAVQARTERGLQAKSRALLLIAHKAPDGTPNWHTLAEMLGIALAHDLCGDAKARP